MVKDSKRSRMPTPVTVTAARPPLRQASTPWFRRRSTRFGVAASGCAAAALGVLLWADIRQGRGQLSDSAATGYGWLIAVLVACGIGLTLASRIANRVDQRRTMSVPRASRTRGNAGSRRTFYNRRR